MTEQGEKLLDLQKVGKQFGATIALKDVDFDLFPGEVHGLVGENGAGKSTLMKILSGVHQEYDGEIIARGKPYHFSSTKEALKQGIGMIYQELSVIKTLSVAENLFLGDTPVTKLGIVDWPRMYREAKLHLTQLGINLDVRTPVGNYTVATQQMIEIASVIFSGAEIIIMDEPTSALSHNEVQHLFNFIRLLKQQGKGIVFISHFIDDVLEISDRITVLRNGQKVMTVNTKEVNKEKITTAMLGKSDKIISGPRKSTTKMQQGSKVLELRNVLFGKRLHGINFSLFNGEILGIFGGMGAGKSELASLLFGINQPDAGNIIFNDKKISLRTTTDAKRLGIAYVPANRRDTIFPEVEVYKNVTISHLPDICPGLVNRNVEVAKTREMGQTLGVRPSDPFRIVSALSGGNQQKAVLAKWLTVLPKLLILNDPTRGMDVGAKQEVMEIVLSLKKKNVATLLLSSEPELIMNYADRVIVLHRGEQIAELPQEEVTKELLVSYL